MNQINIEWLVKEIEARFPVGESTDCALSVTGEPYVVIGAQDHRDGLPQIPGTIDEGKRRELAFDEETAVMSALKCFEDYARERIGTLFWRVKPELEWIEDHSRCKVYLRLLISDKSVMKTKAA
jgi:hypothetical protein